MSEDSRVPRTAFKPGQSGNPAGRPAGSGPSQKRSRLLSAMHWILNRPAEMDTSELQERMRTLYKQDVGKFIDRYTKLEAVETARLAEQGSAQVGNGASQSLAPLPPDEGTEQALALIEQLLANAPSGKSAAEWAKKVVLAGPEEEVRRRMAAVIQEAVLDDRRARKQGPAVPQG